MKGKCNTGGENVKAEVTAQTPVITQIAENLGVAITTPSGTNKQILQGNNTNLLNIKNNAKKEGAYVWKKLTAQGGDFIDFVVSDSETTYPDGGEQGGYWYEKVVEGIDLSALGWTKCAIDYITPSTNIYIKNSPLRHSLGIAPKYIHIKALSTVTTTSYDLILLEFVGCYSTDGSFHGGKMLCRDASGSNEFSPIFSSDSEKIVISDTYLMQGVQYRIITIG